MPTSLRHLAFAPPLVRTDSAPDEDGLTALYALTQEHKIRAEISVEPNPKSWAGLGPTLECARRRHTEGDHVTGDLCSRLRPLTLVHRLSRGPTIVSHALT